MVRRGGAALLVCVPGGLVCWMLVRIPLLVAFASPRMGSGSLVRGRGGARATTGVLRQMRYGTLSRGGVGDVFLVLHAGGQLESRLE